MQRWRISFSLRRDHIVTWTTLVVGDDPLATLSQLADVVVVAVHRIGLDPGGRAADGVARGPLGRRGGGPVNGKPMRKVPISIYPTR